MRKTTIISNLVSLLWAALLLGGCGDKSSNESPADSGVPTLPAGRDSDDPASDEDSEPATETDRDTGTIIEIDTSTETVVEPETDNSTDVPPPECNEETNGCFTVDESRIAALFEEGSVSFTVPLAAIGQETSGHLQLAVVADGDEPLATVETDFTLADAPVTLSVSSAGLPANPEHLVSHFVEYTVTCDTGVTTGRRSLYPLFPHTQAILRGPSQLMAGTENRFRLYVQNPGTNVPLADVAGTFRLVWSEAGEEQSLELFSGMTDEMGGSEVVLDIPDDMPASATVEAAIGNGAISQTILLPVEIKQLQNILLTTDKPLYQPGQTIHIRALALRRPDLEPEANSEVVFEVQDAKGNKVFKEITATDGFGIASAELRLASEVLLGAYTVSIDLGDSRQEKTVTVDRYALPKFDIDLETDSAFYRPGETVTGTVDVQYFFGQPVAGGEVTITAQSFDIEFSTFQIVSGTTDDAGAFELEIVLPTYFVGQPLDDGNAFVLLQVEVTDTAGQARAVETTRPVVNAAILPQVIPESGEVVPGVEQIFYVLTTDPQGRPVSAESSIDIGDDTVTVQSDDSGIAAFTATAEGNQSLSMTVTSTDGTGNEGSRSFAFTPGQDGAFVLLRTDRSVYRVGESAEITVICPDIANAAGAFADRAYVDVIKDGRTVLMTTAILEAGTGQLEIAVTPDLVGGFEIEAYYLTVDGQIMRDRKLVYADPANQLNIDIAQDKSVYAPADEANLTFTITDADGLPVPSAIGLQVVDEAVFSLMEFKPGLEKVFYALQQEILTPRYEIHGYDYNDITSGDFQDDEEMRDSAAELVFAAAAGGSFGVYKDTFADTEARARSLSSEIVAASVGEIYTRLNELCRNGTFSSGDEVRQYVLENPACFKDPFGNPYELAAGSSSNFVFSSAGPDEIEDTGDDADRGFYLYCHDYTGGDADSDADSDSDVDADVDADADGDWDTDAVVDDSEGGSSGPRVRKDFPETLYVNPALITDASGVAELAIPLADSITTWRLTALASSTSGLLGSTQSGVTVFQDFFVDIDFPAQLTQDDEVAVPIAIYNYLDEAQSIALSVESAEWFELMDDQDKIVEVGANEVVGASFRIRVLDVGRHAFTVFGTGTEASDAVARSVEVVPNGKEILVTQSGRLADSISYTVAIPEEAIDDASKIMVKIYPGLLSQVVEGLDSLLRMPSGCFEQTSSATYPNVLVLDYMMSTGQITPEIELKAREYVNLGYQRLLTYECASGGFDWFGDDPGHNILTAYGLLEFSDMARVHPVDPAIIARTQSWLARQQYADGHFEPTSGGIAEGAINAYEDDVARSTAYITYALVESGYAGSEVNAGISWLRENQETITDNYGLAMIANALVAFDPDDAAAQAVLTRLHEGRIMDGDTVYWQGQGESTTYGSGDVMTIETTALAAYAMLRAGVYSEDLGGAASFLVGQKDSFGNWHTTQATILTLRFMLAMVEMASQPGPATVNIFAHDELVETLEIDEATSDVLRLVDLGEQTVEGENALRIDIEGDSSYLYQIVTRYYAPWDTEDGAPADGPLALEVTYDRTTLAVDEMVTATVEVANTVPGSVAKMVLVDLGIPPGFELVTDNLKEAVKEGRLQKFEKTARQLILYIEAIPADTPFTISYQLKAQYPLVASSGESETHPYYTPDNSTQTEPVEFVVE